MKKNLFFYFMVIIPVIVCGQVPDIDLLRARACLDQNKTDSALSILKKFQGTNNNSVLQWIGDCYFRKRDFNKACHYYLIADSMHKGSASYEISRCYAKLSDKTKALSWLQKYLALSNKKSELEIIRDSAFFPVSGTQEWKSVWQKEWYSESEVEQNAINALLAKGRMSEAMTELEGAESKFSPRHVYYYLQAKVYEKQHLLEPAIASGEKAVLMNSFSEDYLVLYANLMSDAKKYNEALESITKAIRLNPYNALYYLKRGEIAVWAGNYQMAEKDLQLYRELYPEVPETYHQLGLLEMHRGNNQNAMEYYDILLGKDNSHAQYFLESGNLAVKLSQIQKADEDFSLALDLNPRMQQAFLQKGNTLFILNDNSGACFYWNKAKELGSSEAAKLLYTNCKE